MLVNSQSHLNSNVPVRINGFFWILFNRNLNCLKCLSFFFFFFPPSLFPGHCFIFVLLGLYYDSVHWWLPEWSHWGRCRSSYCCCILVTHYVLDTSAYLYKQRQTSHTQYFSFIPGFTGNISRSVQIMPSRNLFALLLFRIKQAGMIVFFEKNPKRIFFLPSLNLDWAFYHNYCNY